MAPANPDKATLPVLVCCNFAAIGQLLSDILRRNSAAGASTSAAAALPEGKAPPKLHEVCTDFQFRAGRALLPFRGALCECVDCLMEVWDEGARSRQRLINQHSRPIIPYSVAGHTQRNILPVDGHDHDLCNLLPPPT